MAMQNGHFQDVFPFEHWDFPSQCWFTRVLNRCIQMPWASTTIKIMVDPISMIKTLM